ncbi:sucrose phosphorylase [Marinithermofilum abyssi]|uniref:Sucrose phosphorylase n=1 Tax=Marinithermofilum abyssi TaxID=1571185 RepID=A0A8J2Y958_9BACL|nr:alpha-amylase family glycosyl hydrolase [Marinithermofilum abyssi]GGE15625.1 sucrose phosphorylase [Marinithermofilum abyssi]
MMIDLNRIHGIKESVEEKLNRIYGSEKGPKITERVIRLMEKYKDVKGPTKQWVDQQDVMLITYGDSIREQGKAPLQTLHGFLKEYASDILNAVHILPFYPYSSDDGFSVIDYTQVNSELGDWGDIQRFSADFDLMFDGVINHISQQSEWFQRYRKGDPEFSSFFIEADPDEDYSMVTRPRARPLLTPFDTKQGRKYLWTTFSEDQIDLNYQNEHVFLAVLEVLLFYVKQGMRFLRLDAVGYLWKEWGSPCIHLPQTHLLVQVIREILETVAPGTIIITETNVPHQENIRYFGNGHNEAHMIYQFPLPPLTLYTFHKGDAKHLSSWAASLEPTTDDTTYFNFLASHDGIGVRPVESILTEEEVREMADKVREHGGFVSYKDNGDGTQSPYELNINYLDALSHPDDPVDLKVKRFMAAQAILLSVVGVPGVYIHSLLGSRNDLKGVEKSGRFRSINREKLDRKELERELRDETSLRHQVFVRYKELLNIRRREKAFHPNAMQNVLFLDDRVFSIVRTSTDRSEQILVCINVANQPISIRIPDLPAEYEWKNLFTGEPVSTRYGNREVSLAPYQVLWIKGKRIGYGSHSWPSL